MELQYIALKKDIEIREIAGRFTRLLEKTHGVIIDEESVTKIQKLLKQEQMLYLDKACAAREQGLFLALVAGYVVELHPQDFEYIKQSHFCIGEIIHAGP